MLTPLATGLPHARLRTLLVLALSLLALPLALPTLAQGRKAGCAAGHGRHGAHACAAHRRKAGARHAKRHASKHANAKKRAAVKPAAPRGAEGTVATCEDGSAALPGLRGPAACDDGSIPGCEDGSMPRRSGGSNASLRCPTPTEPDPGANETPCEDGPASPCVQGSEETPGLLVTPCGEAPAPGAPTDAQSFDCEA